jgi:hypothetical protein
MDQDIQKLIGHQIRVWLRLLFQHFTAWFPLDHIVDFSGELKEILSLTSVKHSKMMTLNLSNP